MLQVLRVQWCEWCGEEVDELRRFEGEEICTPCWLEARDDVLADVEDGLPMFEDLEGQLEFLLGL